MVRFPIRSEPPLTHPPVIELSVIRMELGASGKCFAVETEIEILTVP